MSSSEKQASRTSTLVHELEKLFSDKSAGKNLQTIVKNVAYTRRLFVKLVAVIDQCDRQGKDIDQLQTDFPEQLSKLKLLIDENIRQSGQHSEIISSLEDCLTAIREHYQTIRNDVQTLENINEKIDRKLQGKKHKNKIGRLIMQGIDEKIPNMISFDPQASKSEKENLDILKKFYDHFLNYISFIRELSENMFDHDHEYILKLENLQTKLLSKKSINIKDYFLKLKDKILDDNRGYSIEILLRSFVQNLLVHISVSNNSKFYSSQLIQLFEKLITLNYQKCIEPLTTLVYQLDRTFFNRFHSILFQNNQLIDLVFQTIYDKGIELYSSNSNGSSISRKNLEEKFFDLFELILLKKSDLFNRLRESITDEKNSNGIFDLLSNIYGQHIQSLKLNLPNDILIVKYCFNSLFFKSLKYQQIDDVPMPSLFTQLLFYLHTDDGSNQINSNEGQHEQDLIHLKNIFLQVYNEDNFIDLKNLMEIFKIFINLQTYDFRFKTCIAALYQLKDPLNTNEKSKRKMQILKEFFNHSKNEKELCLRLTQSMNVHLLKDVFEDRNVILTKLSEYNSNFKLFIEKFENFFDIDQDLTPGFNIPYYLSLQLIEDQQYNNKNHQILMAILFKVFNSSLDKDGKKQLNKEFMKLFQSVNQFIEFYNQNDHKDIRDDLKKLSLEYILNGFSGKNDDSNLSDRNEYARRMIENMINYKFEHVLKVMNSTKSNVEVINMFHRIMKRKENDKLNDWIENTSQLSEKLYFLYCYHQYSKDQFDKWFKELNPNMQDETYLLLEKNRKLVENEFQENNDAFKYLNIKYLQHNQVGALALIYDYLENLLKNKENLFIKIGTGQGKSLIIAETVRKLIQINRKSARTSKRQVFVITCSDHLAKMDFENYQNYYKHFNIQPIYCSNDSFTKDLLDGDVIYADLKTYFNVLRKDGLHALAKSERIDLPDLSDAILIMDEVDSLILDSDHIFQVAHRFKLENCNKPMRLDHKEDIRKLFNGLFSKEAEQKFATVIDRWYEKLLYEKQEEDKKNDENRKFQDALGNDHTFVSSLLNELLKGSTASFIHFYLNPLVFYCKFKQIIGFSGTITLNGMNRFKTLFENKSCLYYEIPPFFGLSNLENNRKFENKPGLVMKDTYDYLNAIQEEIKSRHSEQPILIFADSFKKSGQEKSDYECIYEKLIEAKETFLKDSTIIKIIEEADINENMHKIGRLGSITLATRIIARGADIKVNKNIQKGLHLLLTYYPERENIYIQMLGRTARQDEKGSYSEITRSPKNFADISQVKVDQRKKICHDVTEYFYKSIPSNIKDKNLALKWNIFSSLMQQMCEREMDQNDLIKFIERNIFKL